MRKGIGKSYEKLVLSTWRAAGSGVAAEWEQRTMSSRESGRRVATRDSDILNERNLRGTRFTDENDEEFQRNVQNHTMKPINQTLFQTLDRKTRRTYTVLIIVAVADVVTKT